VQWRLRRGFQDDAGAKGKWKYSVAHYFSGADGEYPGSSVVFDKEGNLYGTTEAGGARGYGVVYRITP